MLLPNRDGVKCDLCGAILKSIFVYYSYDCHKVSVDVLKKETKKETTDVNKSMIGFDVCEDCHRGNLEKMLENQK